MKKICVSCAIVVSALVAILSSGCGLFSRGSQPDLSSAELNELVKERWTAYGATREGWAGEFHVYVMTPRGNYFACVSPESGRPALYTSAGPALPRLLRRLPSCCYTNRGN